MQRAYQLLNDASFIPFGPILVEIKPKTEFRRSDDGIKSSKSVRFADLEVASNQ